MSEEELEKRLAKMEKEESAREVEQNPELGFAKEAGCTPEVARDVLQRLRSSDGNIRRCFKTRIDSGRSWCVRTPKNASLIVDRLP